MAAIKIIEVLGTSEKSWEDAANEALKEAKKSVRNITGLEILSQTAKIKNGAVSEYHATCKIAFKVD